MITSNDKVLNVKTDHCGKCTNCKCTNNDKSTNNDFNLTQTPVDIQQIDGGIAKF